MVKRLLAVVGEDGEEEIVGWIQQYVEQGRKEGLQKTLLKLLQARFGALPEAVVARVNGAGPTELDLWVERILTAPTLDAVFADKN